MQNQNLKESQDRYNSNMLFLKTIFKNNSIYEVKLSGIKKNSYFLLKVKIKGKLFYKKKFPVIFPKKHEAYKTQRLTYRIFGFVILYRYGFFNF